MYQHLYLYIKQGKLCRPNYSKLISVILGANFIIAVSRNVAAFPTAVKKENNKKNGGMTSKEKIYVYARKM